MHVLILLCIFPVTPEVTSVYPDPNQLNYTVNMGDTVTFECVATGIPAPSITWLRNGMELNNTVDCRVAENPRDVISVQDETGETVFQSTRTLTLNGTEDDDSGDYECMASNDAMPGENMAPFELIVQSEYKKLPHFIW